MKRLYIHALAISSLMMGPIKLSAQPKSSIYTTWENGFTNSLANTHDMALPSWGPYSNKYNGISHVPSANNGLRFDVIVQPSLYLRTLTTLARVQRESGYHPWQASADLSYFSYRYELEWKDRTYCDVSFSRVDNKSRLIKAEFVNNTSGNRSVALNIFGSIFFPHYKTINVTLPEQVTWQKAADYLSLTDSVIAPNYNLVYNGQLRGQVNDDDAVSHTAIIIGKSSGETLSYKIPDNRHLRDGVIVLRYKIIKGDRTKINITVNGKPPVLLNLESAKAYTLATINVKDLSEGDINFTIKTLGGSAIALDGFMLLEKNEVPLVKFDSGHLNSVPKEISVGIPNAIILKYDDVKEFYGIVWSDKRADKRVLLDDDPDVALALFENLVKRENEGPGKIKIAGNNNGWFENVFSAPIILKPRQKVSRYAYVINGYSEIEVADKLKRLNAKWGDADSIYHYQQTRLNDSRVNTAGKPYQFGQQLMAATTLTNLIYPAFAVNKYIKHTTPGKRWSSFYTWDAGFIGLGYAAFNAGRALESLNAYTMDSTEQSAFLEHGTPLPVQGYLFNELWDDTQNTEFLKYFYPRLKRYYNFLGGAESSPTRKLKSNLIQPWDIFYNSGGWDDYSPQVYIHQQRLEKWIAPVVNTSHQIRFAKLLKMAAWQLGYQQDMEKYDADIKMYSNVLQQYSWDEPSGYFGYVKHDNDGNAIGLLKHSSGVNFDMGLDGCSPLIAGICTPHQKERITEHLFTKGQLWTDQGITAIDQTAPYYDKDGYWNGRVWMAHQWFIWKTMLDLNEPQKAIQIAQTALKVWKRETEDSYNCWENFSVETGNGGGWHQFGALSSPVLNWFNALYRQGTITYGFNVWPITQKFNTEATAFSGRFKLFADQNQRTVAMLLCLNEKYNYVAKCNGKKTAIKKLFGGFYMITVCLAKNDSNIFSLQLSKVNR